ncbi:hypothetical protein C4566_01120 [Candidatus Parcubacteria bacterium]|nr:MAG: hypothetical protein C4566_01120 [Candidatus Parcubacteria bacterium]
MTKSNPSRVIFLLLVLSFLTSACGKKEPEKINPITAPQEFVDEQRTDLLDSCLNDCQYYCQSIGGDEYCSLGGKCQSDCRRKFIK